MASKVTPPAADEKGVEEGGAEDAGVVGATGSIVSTHGHFN